MSTLTKLYIGFIIAVGCVTAGYMVTGWDSADTVRFCCFALLAAVSGGLKILLPGVTGTMSGGFLIVLLAVAQLSIRETIAIALISLLVQYVWHSSRRLRLVQAVFNACTGAIAALCTGVVLHLPLLTAIGLHRPLRLAMAALTYYFVNSIIVAIVIALTESKPVRQIFRDYYLWSMPFYFAAALIAEGITRLETFGGWQTAVLAVPAVYAIYKVCAIYADRVEQERKRVEDARAHAEEMSALHLRTIHALAMAIEARDRLTHDHLRRVQIYAVELGRQVGLNDVELEALRTAAVLHDIGKLGVPEHIISKPGRLTPDEFVKVQAHPVIGAEILERVNFPYAVVPIVRCHHERWDGSGYPSGLKGEDIPIGARILSVVDCFDALATDRQYRKAMTTEQALQVVKKASGRDFDPKIVDLLAARVHDLEHIVRSTADAEPPMLTREEIRAAVPAAGFQSALVAGARPYDMVTVVRAGSLHTAFECISQPDLASALAFADDELRPKLGYDYLALYIREDRRIRLYYVTGGSQSDEPGLIDPGDGLSGWVVEEGRPILNGNGRLDGILHRAAGRSDLVSASSVPIQAGDRTVGALSVYSSNPDPFSARDLQVLWSLSAEVGAYLLERSLKPGFTLNAEAQPVLTRG